MEVMDVSAADWMRYDNFIHRVFVFDWTVIGLTLNKMRMRRKWANIPFTKLPQLKSVAVENLSN